MVTARADKKWPRGERARRGGHERACAPASLPIRDAYVYMWRGGVVVVAVEDARLRAPDGCTGRPEKHIHAALGCVGASPRGGGDPRERERES